MAAIYLDNAATTRVSPAVAEAMRVCLVEDFGNPSSVHAAGRRAAARMAEARAQVLLAVGGGGDLVFTSGGTEADYLGVLGAARARGGGKVVVTAFEHPAVLGAAGDAVVVPVGPNGIVDPEAVAAAVTPDTTVVACMLVQNELGTIQPVAEVSRAVKARRRDVHVHCDAVQALGKIPIDATALAVDSLAVSAHKLHGPKGAGALWLAPGAQVRPLVVGGGQERGRRAGTENVAGIVGFGVAAAAAVARLLGTARIAALRDQLWQAVHAAVPSSVLLGEGAPRVPHIAAMGFVTGAAPLAALEAAGVIASAGAACHGSARSHVLDAIGAPEDLAVVRLSLSFETTSDEVAAGARAVIAAVGRA